MSPCLERRGCTFLLLAAVWLLLVSVSLWVRPVLPVDETRYIGVAWEMWLQGDWLVPHLNGEPYHHKPPMLFWLINLAWAVVGVHEWAARLIPALAGLVATWLATVLARKLWPEERSTPMVAAWVLFSGLFWCLFFTTLMFDFLVALFAELGLLGVLLAWRGRPALGWPLMAAAIGLGVLAKGPVILVYLLPAALTAPWWMGEQRPMAWRSWYTGIGLAVLGGAAIALVWVIPAAVSGGEAYREAILWKQTANRVVHSFAHQRPFWWYLPLLPLLLYPWSLWLPLWRGLRLRIRSGLDSGERFVLAVTLPGLLIFSLIGGKQAHYLLPLLPALALWAGRVLAAPNPERPGRGTVTLVVMPLVVVGMVGIVFPIAGIELANRGWMEQLTPWWGVGLLATAAGAAWRMGRRPLAALGVLAPALILALYLGVVRVAMPYYDGQGVASRIAELQELGVPVVSERHYRGEFNFLGRLRHPVVKLEPDEAAEWERRNPEAVLLERVDDLSETMKAQALYWQPFRGGFVVLRRVDAEAAR